jgi:uncharacterized coiled-coil protein SlyX
VAQQQERRSDSYAIPRSAIRFIASLAIVFIGSVSGLIYTLDNQIVRALERIRFLEEFGPIAGDRFTKEQGDKLDTRITSLEARQAHHERIGAHDLAEYRLQRIDNRCVSLEKRLSALEERKHVH